MLAPSVAIAASPVLLGSSTWNTTLSECLSHTTSDPESRLTDAVQMSCGGSVGKPGNVTASGGKTEQMQWMVLWGADVCVVRVDGDKSMMLGKEEERETKEKKRRKKGKAKGVCDVQKVWFVKRVGKSEVVRASDESTVGKDTYVATNLEAADTLVSMHVPSHSVADGLHIFVAVWRGGCGGYTRMEGELPRHDRRVAGRGDDDVCSDEFRREHAVTVSSEQPHGGELTVEHSGVA